ncbi:MAG: sodium:proton exchanger [Actinobacteria bacterium]|nr:sodium:proton exchanger [Actinomycetota bacterium]
MEDLGVDAPAPRLVAPGATHRNQLLADPGEGSIGPTTVPTPVFQVVGPEGPEPEPYDPGTLRATRRIAGSDGPPHHLEREHPVTHRKGNLVAIVVAAAATGPALALRISDTHPAPVLGSFVFGLAVVGAAFLLAWGAEALELDVSKGLALAVLALIAVLPEYAVDFTFAYKAGDNPDKFAPLALANMTGGNRLLIGVGWSLVVLLAAWKIRRIARERGYSGEVDTEVHLSRPHSIEIAFLAVATLYSLSLPLRHRLTLFPDAVILVALFLLYLVRVSRAPAGEPHLVGPAQLIGSLSVSRRRMTVAAMLIFAAVIIVLSAEPFAEGLVESGSELGIDEFLLVQWLAPLASESPELVVACLFALRLNTNAGLGTLVSSKVNQWTLLVGSLPIVFLIAGGSSAGLPLDDLQREELFLTAAQSVFAVAVLMSRSIDVREALGLFFLFISQFILGGVLPEDIRQYERIGVAILYLVLAFWMILRQRSSVVPMFRDGIRTPVHQLSHEEPTPSSGTPA